MKNARHIHSNANTNPSLFMYPVRIQDNVCVFFMKLAVVFLWPYSDLHESQSESTYRS